MKAMAPDGQATAIERKPQLRDCDFLIDRDLYILEWMYGGQRVKNIAKMLKITPSMVYRRVRETPDPVKAAMKRLVERSARGAIGSIHDADKDRVRNAYKKYARSQARAARESLVRVQAS